MKIENEITGEIAEETEIKKIMGISQCWQVKRTPATLPKKQLKTK